MIIKLIGKELIMNKFIILPDVTCDLSKETREKFNLTDYIPSHIILPDGSERKGTLEWDWTTSKDFYKAIKKRNNGYSTSPASIDEIKEKFKYYLNQGYDILFMSISSKLSGTYNFALKAREELLSRSLPTNLNPSLVMLTSIKFLSKLHLIPVSYIVTCSILEVSLHSLPHFSFGSLTRNLK